MQRKLLGIILSQFQNTMLQVTYVLSLSPVLEQFVSTTVGVSSGAQYMVFFVVTNGTLEIIKLCPYEMTHSCGDIFKQ